MTLTQQKNYNTFGNLLISVIWIFNFFSAHLIFTRGIISCTHLSKMSYSPKSNLPSG